MRNRIWLTLAAPTLAGGLMLATASAASATVTTAPQPAAASTAAAPIMMMTPWLPGAGFCTAALDGEIYIDSRGTPWRCEVVIGDTPAFQWEPLPIR